MTFKFSTNNILAEYIQWLRLYVKFIIIKGYRPTKIYSLFSCYHHSIFCCWLDENDDFHSYNDLPAKITMSGAQIWCKNGLTHRDRGPAIITSDGRLTYYFEGKVHRENGPAVIWKNGSYQYVKYGDWHRTDGPAVHILNDRANILYPGKIIYYFCVNGEFHNLNGPAKIIDGRNFWYVNDVNITYDVENWMKENNISYPFSEENLRLFQIIWS